MDKKTKKKKERHAETEEEYFERMKKLSKEMPKPSKEEIIEYEKSVATEIRSLLASEVEEIKEVKRVFADDKTGQYLIRIPKSIVLKSNLNKQSTFNIVFNPSKSKALEEVKNSKLIIFLKEEGIDGDKKEENNQLKNS